MPRLKKKNYELRKRTTKTRRTRGRDSDCQVNYNEMDYQKADSGYGDWNTKEDTNIDSHLYDSYTSDWTGSQHSQPLAAQNENSDSLLEARMKDTSAIDEEQPLVDHNASSSIEDGHMEVQDDTNETDFSKAIKEELKDDVSGDLQSEMPNPTNEAYAGELNDPLPCVEVQEVSENFVVDCDPLIVENPGLSFDINRPLSSDDNSSYSSSSNTQFFSDIMKNNELMYKQISATPSTVNDADLAKALQEHYDKLEYINDEIFEKRKKAAAIQRRRRKRMLEKLNEEQLKEYRATQTAACRQRRMRRIARMSDEERQSDRMLKNALCLARRHRRESMMSDEERKTRRAAAAAAQREKRKRKRETMTEDELKSHKAEVAAIWRMRRHLRYMKMSEEERQAERAKAAMAKRVSRQRQKDKDDGEEPEEIVKPQRRPRRKRARSQCSLSESEPDLLESTSFDGGNSAETLISQILKQTQHIAAMESQDISLVPEHSLDPGAEGEDSYLLPNEVPDKDLGRDQQPKETGETYLLPHEIPDTDMGASKGSSEKAYFLPHEVPDKKGDINTCPEATLKNEQKVHPLSHELQASQPGMCISDVTQSHEMPEKHIGENHCPVSMPEIKQETYPIPQELPGAELGTVHQAEMPLEYHHNRVQDDMQHLNPGEVIKKDQSEIPHLYHPCNMGSRGHAVTQGQFYNKNPMEVHTEMPQQLHHRPQDNHMMRPPPHYHHANYPYDPRTATLHPYHIGNMHGMDRSGPVHQYQHSETHNNQGVVLPQYLHGRNYMNTLY